MAKKRTGESANLAAEYFVASQLFRKGYIVTVTFGNTKQIDLVVIHPETKKTVTVDVKGLKNTTNWPMPRNPLIRKGHFYVLVSFKHRIKNLSFMPEVFVVPSKYVKKLWTPWSRDSIQKGIMYGRVNNKKFKDNWNLLFREKIIKDKPVNTG